MKRASSPWEVLALIGLYTAIALRFPWAPVFSDTILTGGDSGSWHQVLLHLRDGLLPQGRLFGWSQDNFFGYPDFQYYFIPPFLLALLLGSLFPLSVGLKLATLAGTWLTPLAVWWMLRAQGRGPWERLGGAALSLIFLFHERFDMFGGNLLSTLAGEFAYSLAFALQILLIGALFTDLPRRRIRRPALLLALTGLSHAFVFLSAVLLPLWFLLRRGGLRRLPEIAALYGLAFLFMAFWTLPMLAGMPYTTPIRAVWQFPQWSDLFHQAFGEVILLALVLQLLARWKGRPRPSDGFFLYGMIVSAGLYLTASLLHIADIRFFPPLLFFALMSAWSGLHALLRALPTPHPRHSSAAALALAGTLGLGTLWDPQHIGPRWFLANYAGYQATPAFAPGAEMDQLHRLLAKVEGRVGWEHAAYGPRFGTDRVFENLPLFTGHPTTEGIHYASALLARAVTTVTAEISLRIGSPSPIVYSHYDPDLAERHLRLLHVNHVIIASPLMQGLLNEHPGFQLVGRAGSLALYRLSRPSPGLVEGLSLPPLACDCGGARWKDRLQAWFRRGGPEPGAPLLVPQRFIADHARHHFPATVVMDRFGRTPAPPALPRLPPATISEVHIDGRQIRFRTDRPGQPHLIKVAYHPNWQAATGETLYPVSPGLMLIYPRGQTVHLEYRRSPWEWLGMVLTVGGLLITVSLTRRSLPRSWRRIWLPLAWHPRRLRPWRTPLRLAATLILLIGAILAYQEKHRITADLLAGNALAAQGRWSEAVNAYRRALSEDNLDMDHADLPTTYLALATAYLNMGALEQAQTLIDTLLDGYPNWIYLPEALALAADIARARGQTREARELLLRCMEKERDPQRRRQCVKRLAALSDTA